MDRISNRVMKVYESGNSVVYRVACDCGSPECDIWIEVELDKNTGLVFIKFHKKIILAPDYSSFDIPIFAFFSEIIVGFWRRVKLASKIMWTGRATYEESFVLNSEEHIEGFMAAIKEGINFFQIMKEYPSSNNAGKVLMSGVLFEGKCDVASDGCTAKTKGSVTAIWTSPGRTQVNVCGNCFKNKKISGDWKI